MKKEEKDFLGKLTHVPFGSRQWKLFSDPPAFFNELIEKYGDFLHCRGLIDFYLVNHPSLVSVVLKETNRSFDKNSIIYNRFKNAMGDGIVTAEGDRWKKQRKLLQPVFRPTAIHQYFETMLHSTLKLVDRWSEKAEKNTPFDLSKDMYNLALEITGKSLFSHTFDKKSAIIDQWTKSINEYCAKLPIPILSNLNFPLPVNIRLRKTLKEYATFIDELISERANGHEEDDLLTLLMNLQDEETGKKLTNHEIAEEAMAMVVGGHETTSSALTWIFFELGNHPEVENRVRQEIQQLIGGRPLVLEQINDFKYLRMVVEETLRLHPPFWFENRNVSCDLELSGSLVPRGSLVVFSRYALHRHHDFWVSPDDFRPERFSPGEEENSRQSCAYVPFGAGPRACMGRHFAMMEIMVAAITILQNYKLTAVHRYEKVPLKVRMTMELKHGHVVILEKNKS